MTYTRVNSRPAILDSHHKLILRSLFVVKLSNILSNETVIFSIDVVMFSRNTKFNYSWQHKGINKNFYNQSVRGSKSLIWAIVSTGDYFVYEVKTRNNSETFIQFLESLNEWIEDKLCIRPSQIIVLMDNWSIHRTINVKLNLKEFKWKVIMPHPYTPEYNLIKFYFVIVKRRFWRQTESLVIKINNEYGISPLKEVIVSIARIEIIRFFIKILKTARLHFSYMLNL